MAEQTEVNTQMQDLEKGKSEEIPMTLDETKKRQEIEYEGYLQRKLGETHFSMIDGAVHVDHKIQCCGKEIEVLVLELVVEGQAGLINEEFLKACQMSPAERRARNMEEKKLKNKSRNEGAGSSEASRCVWLSRGSSQSTVLSSSTRLCRSRQDRRTWPS